MYHSVKVFERVTAKSVRSVQNDEQQFGFQSRIGTTTVQLMQNLWYCKIRRNIWA